MPARRCRGARGDAPLVRWPDERATPTSTQADGFTVDLPVFAGPFRLLADLILEQKVDVRRGSGVDHRAVPRLQPRSRNGGISRRRRGSSRSVRPAGAPGRPAPRHADLDEEDLLGGSPDLGTRGRSSWPRSGPWRPRSRGGSRTRPATSLATRARARSFPSVPRSDGARGPRRSGRAGRRAAAAAAPPGPGRTSRRSGSRWPRPCRPSRSGSASIGTGATFRDLVGLRRAHRGRGRFLAILELYREGRSS